MTGGERQPPSVSSIRSLREKTGAGIGDCRRALEEAGGDLARAEQILRRRGYEIAEKKAGREARQGVVEAYVHAGGRIGVLLELNCETDFVARTEAFRTLAHELCLQIAAMAPETVEALLEQPHIRDSGGTVRVKDLIAEATGKLGEKITVGRFARFAI